MSDRGHWMQLVSGKPFFPLDPRPEDIDINDIAHALSMVCRFGGHVHSFYSVAEHSVRVSDAIRDAGGSLEEEFAGLLHDASEAYLGDVIWPLKVSPELGAYRAVEERVERVIAEAFGMLWPLPKIVKQFDLVLLATEKRDLMLSHANGGVKLEAQASAARLGWNVDGIEPLPKKIDPYSNLGAKHLFLSKFMRLSEARLHVNRRPQEAARNAIMALRCNEAGDELADALKAWVLAEERVRIAKRDLDPASPFVTTWMQARIEATDALGRIRRVGETAFLLAIAATDRQEADSHAE